MPGEYDSMARAFMGTPQGARIIGFLDQLNRLMQGPEGRELLSLHENEQNDPSPTPRDAKFYHSRPCMGFVQSAARLLEEKLKDE